MRCVWRGRAVAALSDNRKWRSHGRAITVSNLRDIGLKIDDFDKMPKRAQLIKDYHGLVSDVMAIQGLNGIVHAKDFI